MAIHSSILTWRIPWTEEPGGLQSMGREELNMTESLLLLLLLLSCFSRVQLFETWWTVAYQDPRFMGFSR